MYKDAFYKQYPPHPGAVTVVIFDHDLPAPETQPPNTQLRLALTAVIEDNPGFFALLKSQEDDT